MDPQGHLHVQVELGGLVDPGDLSDLDILTSYAVQEDQDLEYHAKLNDLLVIQ